MGQKALAVLPADPFGIPWSTAVWNLPGMQLNHTRVYISNIFMYLYINSFPTYCRAVI